MTKRWHGWIALAILIAAMLGSAYLIVDRNHAAMGGGEEIPTAGIIH
jgi:hypothetical protein